MILHDGPLERAQRRDQLQPRCPKWRNEPLAYWKIAGRRWDGESQSNCAVASTQVRPKWTSKANWCHLLDCNERRNWHNKGKHTGPCSLPIWKRRWNWLQLLHLEQINPVFRIRNLYISNLGGILNSAIYQLPFLSFFQSLLLTECFDILVQRRTVLGQTRENWEETTRSNSSNNYPLPYSNCICILFPDIFCVLFAERAPSATLSWFGAHEKSVKSRSFCFLLKKQSFTIEI